MKDGLKFETQNMSMPIEIIIASAAPQKVSQSGAAEGSEARIAIVNGTFETSDP
jgi:hypothetical protein